MRNQNICQIFFSLKRFKMKPTVMENTRIFVFFFYEDGVISSAALQVSVTMSWPAKVTQNFNFQRIVQLVCSLQVFLVLIWLFCTTFGLFPVNLLSMSLLIPYFRYRLFFWVFCAVNFSVFVSLFLLKSLNVSQSPCSKKIFEFFCKFPAMIAFWFCSWMR